MGILDIFGGGGGPEKALKLKSKVTQKYGDPTSRQKAIDSLGSMKISTGSAGSLGPTHAIGSPGKSARTARRAAWAPSSEPSMTLRAPPGPS